MNIRKKNYTSPKTNDGMKVIRHPITTSALMVMRFTEIPCIPLKASG